MTVDVPRIEAGRNPHDKDLHDKDLHDKDLHDMVGELSTRCDAFRTRWGSHNVRRHGSGSKRFHHQLVGDLTLRGSPAPARLPDLLPRRAIPGRVPPAKRRPGPDGAPPGP
jgi:hypothetical protein